MKLNLFAIAALVFAPLVPLHADDWSAQREQVLALGTLNAAPAMYDAEGFASDDGIKAIFFDVRSWKGTPTRAFAWLGVPTKREGKVPGVVLVHGGGGTAFREWVKKWNDHGFAAISIAVEGQTDERDPANPRAWQRHAWAGPARDGIYGDSAEPLADQWMYHAVADTVLANSLLRSLPEVDADKVGLMGISWGGVITSTVIGIDPRFAFAESIVRAGKPWCQQTVATTENGIAQVTFTATKPLDRALLISTTDVGITGDRKWIESPAKLEPSGDNWKASALLPEGTTAWFINVRSGELTASSDYQDDSKGVDGTNDSQAKQIPAAVHGVRFRWDRVPLDAHVGKPSDDFSGEQLDFLAKHFDFIAIEKSQALRKRGSTEAGIAEAARQIKLRNPNAKVLFYWNTFLDIPGYEASKDLPTDGHLNDLSQSMAGLLVAGCRHDEEAARRIGPARTRTHYVSAGLLPRGRRAALLLLLHVGLQRKSRHV